MAENVVKMNTNLADKERKVSASKRLGDFLSKNRIVLLILLCVIVLGFIAYAVTLSVYSASVKKNLGVIETIEFSLTKDAAELEESVISARQDTALSNLEPYLKKGGIVGARAEMLAADIHMQRKDWNAARDLWLDAAAKRKGTYLASVCNFNAASCSEELGDTEAALEYYAKVCDDKNFVDRSRAYFNAGRIKESLGDFEGAADLYGQIASLEYSSDTWNDLAQTRLVLLRAEGKIQ